MRAPKWKILLYASILIFGIVTAIPNVLTNSQLDQLPGWFPREKVTLGLDLRGGSHMVLEVDSKALVKERLENIANDARALLREEKVQYKGIRPVADAVLINYPEPLYQHRESPYVQ